MFWVALLGIGGSLARASICNNGLDPNSGAEAKKAVVVAQDFKLPPGWSALFKDLPEPLIQELLSLQKRGVEMVPLGRSLWTGAHPQAVCDLSDSGFFVLRVEASFAVQPLESRVRMLAHEASRLRDLLDLSERAPLSQQATAETRRRYAWEQVAANGTETAALQKFDFEQRAFQAEEKYLGPRSVFLKSYFRRGGSDQIVRFELSDLPARFQMDPIHEAARLFMRGKIWDPKKIQEFSENENALANYLRNQSWYPVLARLVEPAFPRIVEAYGRVFEQEIAKLTRSGTYQPTQSEVSDLQVRLMGTVASSIDVSNNLMNQVGGGPEFYGWSLSDLMYAVFRVEATKYSDRFSELRDGSYFKMP